MRFEKREDLLPLITEDFYQYYRRNRNDRYENLTSESNARVTLRGMFYEMQEMLEECNHGIYLKGFGVVSPKDTVAEDNGNLFKVTYKKMAKRNIVLENEYLASQYRVHFIKRYSKDKKKKELILKTPRPYAVILHRNKLRKNKLKDSNDED